MYKFILSLAMLCSVQVTAQSLKKKFGSPKSFSVSVPLRDLFETESEGRSGNVEMEDRSRRPAHQFRYSALDGAVYGDDPSVRQTSIPLNRTASILASWAGQVGTGNPPDPSGAAGLSHYVQAVNATRMKVWDKFGNAIGTVIDVGRLWSPVVSNGGDPILLYDKYADRWIITQLDGNSFADFHIAVSVSGDPTGSYYTYSYTANDFPDYPKYSIWADGYYMTSNYLSSDPLNPSLVFSFERDRMLAGDPGARYVSAPFDPGITSGFFIAMPGDADGQLPPFGDPMPIISLYDNGWAGGADSIKIWNVSVDWSGATPTASVTQTPSLLPAPFDASYDFNWEDIPQPNTSAMLDGMGGIVQFRAQWRRWTGYNTMVICLPVRLSLFPPIRQMRWMELRQDQANGTWNIHQESTFAPDDYCRWMGSIAMDDEGNIALCYAKSGPTSLLPHVFPSLGFTGRLASDPLNTMTFGENMVVNGTSILNLIRFGDYSQTSLDPDGLTFWHTGEYVSLGKRTQVYAFRLTSLPVGTDQPVVKSTFSVVKTTGQWNVKAEGLTTSGMHEISIFDLNGKQIQKIEKESFAGTLNATLDVSGLGQGVYLVRLGKSGSSFQKVVKVSLN